ncbi:MAG TPA: endonuclease NucS domain-containing protein [Terracidiphilus sp.]|nr:endonuclease NucS domain-containing protein [Terracidiphilus sp.]
MYERDLQTYLFEHPETLFPAETILEKAREFGVHGKRIDLLFRTKDVRYIIELKAVPLSREHVGQVVEYYGMMRDILKEEKFKMVLVAPSIPDFRQKFLEELGIRCVVIPSIPAEELELKRIQHESVVQSKRECIESEVIGWLPSDLPTVRYEQLVSGVTKESLAISHRLLKDSLPGMRNAFTGFEILPIKMLRADSPDVICDSIPADLSSAEKFSRGGVWWAYGFGKTEQMPKNNVPNISAVAMPWCFDLAINAELRPSQAVMRKRIAAEPSRFDRIVSEHGMLQFQAILKLEHQPRFYHWFPLVRQTAGTWCAKSFLATIDGISSQQRSLNDSWMSFVETHRPEMSSAQKIHMRRRNQGMNLALRIVRPFQESDVFWSLPYSEQCSFFVSECDRLKPLIDFLR